jgi:hypothetical protein
MLESVPSDHLPMNKPENWPDWRASPQLFATLCKRQDFQSKLKVMKSLFHQ